MDIRPFVVDWAKHDDLGEGDIIRYKSYPDLYKVVEFKPENLRFRLVERRNSPEDQGTRRLSEFDHSKKHISEEFFLIRKKEDIRRLQFLRLGYLARYFEEVSTEFDKLLIELEI